MQKRLSDYDVLKWVSEFLDQLKLVKEEQETLKVHMLDRQATDQIVQAYARSSDRCILLDYDGTLTPLQRFPSQATPSSELIALLTQLSANEQNKVVIISGRDKNTLKQWLGHLPIVLVAEHGACVRYVNEEWQGQVSVTSEWKEQLRPLLELFVTRCVGSFIEEKENTLAWHYRNTHPDLGFIRSRELRNSLLQLITNTPLQVIDGNKVLEIRLIGVDKGNSVKRILDYYPSDFILCVGDDATDEDMFRVLKENAFTIKVGNGNTAAQYTLPNQSYVLPLLQRLPQAIQEKLNPA